MPIREKGFTLFELIITIAVAATIVSIGVPAFRSFLQNNRAVTHTNELVTALNLARNEATRRGREIQVCGSSNGTSCNTATDWTGGWIVRVPDNDPLRVWSRRSGGDNLVTANRAQIRFGPRGSLVGGGEATFDVRLPDCTGEQRRRVTVGAAGRIAVARGACQ